MLDVSLISQYINTLKESAHFANKAKPWLLFFICPWLSWYFLWPGPCRQPQKHGWGWSLLGCQWPSVSSSVSMSSSFSWWPTSVGLGIFLHLTQRISNLLDVRGSRWWLCAHFFYSWLNDSNFLIFLWETESLSESIDGYKPCGLLIGLFGENL